MSHSQLRE
jgi:hypothetical protein